MASDCHIVIKVTDRLFIAARDYHRFVEANACNNILKVTEILKATEMLFMSARDYHRLLRPKPATIF